MTAAPERLISAAEAAALLGVSRSFVTRHAAAIGAIKVGRHLRVSPSGLAAYQARQRVTAPAPEPATRVPERRRLSVVGLGPTNPIDGLPWEAAR